MELYALSGAQRPIREILKANLYFGILARKKRLRGQIRPSGRVKAALYRHDGAAMGEQHKISMNIKGRRYASREI